MSFPDFPKWPWFAPAQTYTINESDGQGTVYTAEMLMALNERSSWLWAQKTKRPAMWADGPDAYYAITGAASRPSRDLLFGSFLVPPQTNTSGVMIFASYAYWAAAEAQNLVLNWYHPGDGAEMGAGDWGQAYNATTINVTGSKGGGAGFQYLTTEVRNPDPSKWWVLRVWGENGLDATTLIGGVALWDKQDISLDDGGTIPSSWQVLSHSGMATTDRPAHAYALRTIARQQNYLAAKYANTYGSHSFGASTTAAGATTSYTYPTRRGPNTGNLTVRVYALVGSGTGTLTVYHDEVVAGVPGGPTSRAGPTNVTSTTGAWYTLTVSAGSTANADHLTIVTAAAPGGASMTVQAIVIEDAGSYDFTTYAYGTGGRYDRYPYRPLAPAWGNLRVGSAFTPIAAAHWTQRSDDWFDLAALEFNAEAPAIRRSQVLVADAIGRNGATGTSTEYTRSTSVIWSSAATLWRTQWAVSYGVSYVEVFVRVRKKGTANNYRPKIGIKSSASASFPPGSYTRTKVLASSGEHGRSGGNVNQPSETWLNLGPLAVTEGTTWEMSLAAGFVEQDGTTSPGATADDAIVLEGVFIREIANPPTLADAYFYGTATPGSAIPAGGSVTSDITRRTNQTFPVNRVRVTVDTTHATPTQLSFELSPDGGTTYYQFKDSSENVADGTWSDDTLTDRTPTPTAGVFDSIAGATGNTWRLRVSSSGLAGTLVSWNLELW